MIRVLVYQLAVNSVWFACVFGGAWGLPWLGVGAALAWIALHLAGQSLPQPELLVVLFAGVLGALADLILIHMGGLAYTGIAPGALFGPIWIVALWMAFATSVNVSLRWLRQRPMLGAAFGAVGGNLAYQAGQKLGAVSFSPMDPQPALALALVWGLAIPVLVQVAAWCEDLRSRARPILGAGWA